MPQVDTTAASNLAASLGAGIASISASQSVNFTLYSILRVSDDGTVYWVAGSQQTFPGALHYATSVNQNEAETIAVNEVTFDAPQEVTAFNATAPGTMWVAPLPVTGGTIYVAFKDRGQYFENANVWHYRGEAVFPTHSTQIIASSSDLPSGPIVSNSLPIWLAQNGTFPVYPSFLVPANARPPYIVAHVAQTRALAGFPAIMGPPVKSSNDPAPMYEWSSMQLMADTGRLTLYGLNNQQATQFLTNLMDTSRATDAFGFMESPAFYDERDAQPEIQAIAMKKTMPFSVSYYLSTADAFARRYILSAATPTVSID